MSYVASQPWPFPSSLMLGFEARAEPGEPHAADDELADVRWFERSEVARTRRPAAAICCSPPSYAIARRLIDAWLAAGRALRSGRSG